MRYQFQSGERVYEVELKRQGETFRVRIDGKEYTCEVLDAQPGQISLRFDGRPATVYLAADGPQKWLSLDGCTYRLQKPVPRPRRAAGEQGAGEVVRAPMPAQVRQVLAVEGASVEKGDTLLLLEAMKMEIRVRAPAAGRVKRLLVAAGQAVEKEQVLVEMEGE